MRIMGIYQIQSVSKPERIYIGSAVSIQHRKYVHLYRLRKGRHESPKLQSHYNKYGEADLVFSTIEPCLPEVLTVREQHYIDTLKPWFNIRLIAESNLGIKWSEESKARVRGVSRGKGIKRSPETCKNISNSKIGNKNATGCKRSEEFKDNLRIIKTGNTQGIGNKSRTGQTNSDVSNKSRSKSMQGKRNALGHEPWNKGKKGMYSEETLNKMRGDNNGMKKKSLMIRDLKLKKSEYDTVSR